VIRALHRIGNLLRDRPRVDADPLDEVPRKEPVGMLKRDADFSLTRD
jgi:hypothetical protein